MLSIILLALPHMSWTARVEVHRPLPSSLEWLNESRVKKTSKLLLWEKIDEYAAHGVDGQAQQSIMFFEDNEVQGTLGGGALSYSLGFTAMAQERDPGLENSLQLQIRGASQYIYLRNAFEINTTQVMIFQGESVRCACFGGYTDIATFPLGLTSESLEALLTPSSGTFQSVFFNLNAREGGHKKWGIWSGALLKPLPSEPFIHGKAFNAEDAWKLACPQGPTGKARKMVIPLEAKPFDPAELMEKAEVKRLLSYRKGLLYFKYLCKGPSKKLGQPRENHIRILKVSLMIKYETASTYDVRKDGQIVETRATGKTFLMSP